MINLDQMPSKEEMDEFQNIELRLECLKIVGGTEPVGVPREAIQKANRLFNYVRHGTVE